MLIDQHRASMTTAPAQRQPGPRRRGPTTEPDDGARRSSPTTKPDDEEGGPTMATTPEAAGVQRTAKPTLNSIARATGVSRQTVSNVLNDPDRVAEPTRTPVNDEIRRVGYRPSAAARQLRTRRSHLLGFRMRP